MVEVYGVQKQKKRPWLNVPVCRREIYLYHSGQVSQIGSPETQYRISKQAVSYNAQINWDLIFFNPFLDIYSFLHIEVKSFRKTLWKILLRQLHDSKINNP